MIQNQKHNSVFLDKFIALFCVLLVYATPYRFVGLPLPELMTIFIIVLSFFYY